MGSDLGVELDEGGRLLLVLGIGVGPSEDRLSLEQLSVGLDDFLSTPIDRIDLFAEETEEAELVRGSLLVGNVAGDERAVRFELFGGRSGKGVSFLRLGRLEDRLGRELEVGSLG